MSTTSRFARTRNALLFGGAIAAASSAHAGITLATNVTLNGNNIYNQNRLIAYVANSNITDIQPGEGYYGYLNVQTHQQWTGGAFNFTPYGSSVSLSAFSPTGFSLAVASGVNGNSVGYTLDVWFIVEETGTYRLRTGGANALYFWHYGGTAENPTSAGSTGDSFNDPIASYDSTVVLERGLHRLNTHYGFGEGNPNASAFVTFEQVPAPGAAAVLGLAGLARSRRRR